ncbi:tho complex subunit 7 mft1p [Fusarium circinatum]|uniref:Tho complex subunit 7 mft1p n=1 Tax=Fusarium circinatum TaxID=48490 RepID=A0A8H5WKF3_FUSCI|nr:tho complex subunit 7 mft1p [Fusarium circinatum]
MASTWDLLDPEEEVELHKTRLLNVEEKPFKRLTKRINTISQLLLPFDPAINGADTSEDIKSKLKQLKEDMNLDFDAFGSSITRMQFLHNANSQERERYRVDQDRILADCQSVRQNNIQLREQLEAAQATLAQRKQFDELAEKITSNRLLRPREDQITNLAKLEEECRELERESETYSETWRERREQFNRIMEEGMLLRRQIRDEKEEVDRREGMNEDAEDDAEVDKVGQTPRNEPSGNATPHPDLDSQMKADGDAGTLNPEALNGGTTPMRDTPGPDTLKPPSGHNESQSRGDSQAPSWDVSPMPPHDERKAESGEDVDMEESEFSRAQDDGGMTPQVTVEPPESNGDKMEVDN